MASPSTAHRPTDSPGSPVGQRLVDRYSEVRTLTDRLATPLSAEDQTVQSMPDVSPTKWHRAHVTWFFETFVLTPHLPDYEVFDEDFAFLFNSYYEAVGPRYPRAQRGLITRPGIDSIARYRRAVDEAMWELLAGPIEPDVAALVELGLHHEQQHQELLLMDIKHVLAQNPIRPTYQERRIAPRLAPKHEANEAPLPGSSVDQRSWSEFEGGLIEIGHGGPGFSFDNEGPRHRTWLEPFRLDRHLVTNGEWIEFMADGGYERPELWLSEGWATVQANAWTAPEYWRATSGGWSVFTLHGELAVDPAEPVCHVSHFEADAFARWAGARLPLEAEWEHAAALDPVLESPATDAVRMHPAGPAAPEDRQWAGQVWQWTASPYTAYPGYSPAAGAVGEYNGKFMSNQMVLRGGACVTPHGHSRPTYRNFFPSGARWVFAGVRLAADR